MPAEWKPSTLAPAAVNTVTDAKHASSACVLGVAITPRLDETLITSDLAAALKDILCSSASTEGIQGLHGIRRRSGAISSHMVYLSVYGRFLDLL
jgi:hypothetical protein